MMATTHSVTSTGQHLHLVQKGQDTTTTEAENEWKIIRQNGYNPQQESLQSTLPAPTEKPRH